MAGGQRHIHEGTIAIKSVHGKYLSAQPDGSAQWNRDVANAWEHFHLEKRQGGKIVLRGAHGMYVSAQPDGSVQINRRAAPPGGWEEFTVEIRPNVVCLKSCHWKYLSAQQDGTAQWNRDHAPRGGWEEFQIEHTGNTGRSFTSASDESIQVLEAVSGKPVRFKLNNPPNHNEAWVGIYPTSASDQDHGAQNQRWKYIRDIDANNISFQNQAEGDWNIRVFSDGGYTLVERKDFTIHSAQTVYHPTDNATKTQEKFEFVPVSEYDEVWNDSGSGAEQDVSVWRPRVPAGSHLIGMTAKNGHSRPTFSTLVIRAGGRDIAPPERFDLVWWQERGKRRFWCWRPIPPAGYVSLGDVGTTSDTPPSHKDVVCVALACLSPNRQPLGGQIWNDRGGGAPKDAAFFTQPGGTGLFRCSDDATHNKPHGEFPIPAGASTSPHTTQATNGIEILEAVVGKPVRFRISNRPSSNDAWVGIYPPNASDQDHGTQNKRWKYIRDIDVNNASLPKQAEGRWSIRVFSNGGHALHARKDFDVKAQPLDAAAVKSTRKKAWTALAIGLLLLAPGITLFILGHGGGFQYEAVSSGTFEIEDADGQGDWGFEIFIEGAPGDFDGNGMHDYCEKATISANHTGSYLYDPGVPSSENPPDESREVFYIEIAHEGGEGCGSHHAPEQASHDGVQLVKIGRACNGCKAGTTTITAQNEGGLMWIKTSENQEILGMLIPGAILMGIGFFITIVSVSVIFRTRSSKGSVFAAGTEAEGNTRTYIEVLSFNHNQPIRFRINNPPHDNSAWVGVYPANAKDRDHDDRWRLLRDIEVDNETLPGQTKGQWSIRVFSDGGYTLHERVDFEILEGHKDEVWMQNARIEDSRIKGDMIDHPRFGNMNRRTSRIIQRARHGNVHRIETNNTTYLIYDEDLQEEMKDNEPFWESD